jgi:hypothetical protein
MLHLFFFWGGGDILSLHIMLSALPLLSVNFGFNIMLKIDQVWAMWAMCRQC